MLYFKYNYLNNKKGIPKRMVQTMVCVRTNQDDEYETNIKQKVLNAF